MALVAWAPQGYNAPMELLAVMIPPGQVTERQWLDALADRVTELAIQAGARATLQACSALDLPMTDNPNEAGQYLVEGNWNLKTHLNLALYDNPWLANAEELEEAREALEMTDLESWVEYARSQVSESSLD